MNRRTLVLLAALLGALPAQADHQHAHPGAGDAASALSSGEVRKVDKEARKLTIKHGPLRNLDMPAMTMVFQVKDPAMLDRVKAGDRVNFVADRIDGNYVVTRIESAK